MKAELQYNDFPHQPRMLCKWNNFPLINPIPEKVLTKIALTRGSVNSKLDNNFSASVAKRTFFLAYASNYI